MDHKDSSQQDLLWGIIYHAFSWKQSRHREKHKGILSVVYFRIV
ncbi:hypothetical protein SUBVAR_06553 [Subdoligranulum variabile DSM 15176]|uniref:Uncharacterized protein n=1 Tax=Subdoligranulum variabile DSM 15176 TaxID=411471 RepID=D1PQ84_9FIRM|nr:hypothetical protein SUBVAR_06553 [Subdoligranulum variabile DSM 15176]